MLHEKAIKKQVLLLRQFYNINLYPNFVDRKCIECDRENLKLAILNHLGYEQISLSNLGIPNPYHRASLIGFNTSGGPKWFIVDPTYGQFFENKLFKNYMFKNYKEFSFKLLNQGYIECTLSNIKSYIDGFIYSNAFTNNIDENLVYQKIEELLQSNNIVNKEIKDLQNKFVKVLKLRTDQLQINHNNI